VSEANEPGGVYCELNAPLEWKARGETAGGVSSAHDAANENCLRIVLGLDDVVHELADEAVELSQELQRLDFKVNVILELVAQLVSQNLSLPEDHAIKLGSHFIQWLAQTPPGQVGQSLELKLYLDSRFPFPLRLTGRISALDQLADGCNTTLALDQQQEQTQELLEKYVFRCHRRHIARMKTQTANN